MSDDVSIEHDFDVFTSIEGSDFVVDEEEIYNASENLKINEKEQSYSGSDEFMNNLRTLLTSNEVITNKSPKELAEISFPPDYFIVEEMNDLSITGILLDTYKLNDLLYLHKYYTMTNFSIKCSSHYKKDKNRRIETLHFHGNNPKFGVKNLFANFICHKGNIQKYLIEPSHKSRKTSSKVPCPASLFIHQYFMFDDYIVDNLSRRKLKLIKNEIQNHSHNNYNDLRKTIFIKIQFPLKCSHKNHVPSMDDIILKQPLSDMNHRIYAFSIEQKKLHPLHEDALHNEYLEENSKTDVANQKCILLRSGDYIPSVNDWLPSFFTLTNETEENISGFVRDNLEMDNLLLQHYKIYKSKFKKKLKNNYRKQNKRIFLNKSNLPFQNQPFVVKCRYICRCTNYSSSCLSLPGSENNLFDNCNAKIVIVHIDVFKNVMPLNYSNRLQKRKLLEQLKIKLNYGLHSSNISKYIYIEMPKKEAHSDICQHLTNDFNTSTESKNMEDIDLTYFDDDNKDETEDEGGMNLHYLSEEIEDEAELDVFDESFNPLLNTENNLSIWEINSSSKLFECIGYG